jgi:hypothetical protein
MLIRLCLHNQMPLSEEGLLRYERERHTTKSMLDTKNETPLVQLVLHAFISRWCAPDSMAAWRDMKARCKQMRRGCILAAEEGLVARRCSEESS